MKSDLGAFFEKPRYLLLVDSLITLPFLLLPLLIKLPYRVNIFLSWEGAYRLSLGQTPYEDFGLPMGFAYWIVPTLFFKIFGPTMMSLVKAQVLINLISLLALRGILYNLKIKPLAVSLALLVFCLTYVIYNFWPWYNHSVVVYELVALYFLTRFDQTEKKVPQLIAIGLAGFFSFISFFTKQDVGGISLLLGWFLVSYYGLVEKTWKPLIVYTATLLLVGAITILPYAGNNFFYWFNYGQPPHSSRIDPGQLLNLFLNNSLLEKVYLLMILTGLFLYHSSIKNLWLDKKQFVTASICIALILQSIVIRLTSPLPTDHMNYYHTFGFIGISLFLPWEAWSRKLTYVLLPVILLTLTFSAGYWKYLAGFIPTANKSIELEAKPSKPWVEGQLGTLKKVLVPPETNEGIKKIMDLPFLEKENLLVLNMSELTSLAYEIGYTPITHQPLWFHLNIGIFDKEVAEISEHVQAGYYDLVLFEDIPSLTEFYPYAVQSELYKNYVRIDSFLAPRKLEDSTIEVFIHPDLARQYGLTPVDDQTMTPHD